MAKALRCAIYTRKSTEEGLDQDFNSLDAQREACAAYILSQRHEGWQELSSLYDDGGFSGGTLERPGLTRLLAGVEAGEIDVVVVYKVDRLTRALADFARIVQIFDGAGVSFVSVTQAFNTTTSMGRLTLNVLLSFAQFEREVTAERIRDKIAASKAKGMWMGGTPPIGYRPENRKLIVDPEQAETVRLIFRRYLELRSVRMLQVGLDKTATRTPVRLSRAGRTSGGCAFAKGKLYAMLSNPVYVGKTRHRDKVYDGQHEAIIDAQTWEKAQALLATNRITHRNRSDAARPSPLAGKLFDPAGDQMRPVHTAKTGRRYRYYVSPPLIDSSVEAGASGWRIPAEEIEVTLARAICKHLDRPEVLSDVLRNASDLTDPDHLLESVKGICDRLRAPQSKDGKALLREITERADLCEDALGAIVNLEPAIGKSRSGKSTLQAIEISAPIALARRGAELKLILKGAGGEVSVPDPNLIRTVLDARRRLAAYNQAKESLTLSQIATAEGTDKSDVSRSLQLAFLAPDLIAAILDGRQQPELTATRLKRLDRLPLLWEDQKAKLD